MEVTELVTDGKVGGRKGQDYKGRSAVGPTFLAGVSGWLEVCDAGGDSRERSLGSSGKRSTLEMGKATHSSILAWRIPWTV